MNFQFPISKEDGSAYTTEELFDLLAKELTGHYLLGNYNYWHGGIHFSDATVAYCKDKQPIHCIADGQIIAYRINDNYCRSEYIPDRNNSSSDNNLSLFYSNSFCLVKHDYTSPAKETPKKETPSKAQQWVGRYFRLSTERNIRDKSTTNDKECDFTGKLPKDSQIQIIEMAEPKGDYTIAKVKIIAIAGNQAINNTNPNKNATTKEITKNVGDEVYIAAFDKEANIKIINNSPLLTEYTPAATLVNQTVKLNTVTVAKVTLINTNQILLERINNLRTLNLFNKRDNNTTIPFSSTTTQSDNRDQLTYEAKLPQGTQVQIITIQETQANVKLTRPVTAQLVTSNVTEVDKWLQLQAGDIVTITLYQNNQQILATYKATTSAQTAPILETTSPASSWDGQMIILDKDTPATDDKEYSHGVKFQLPAGTKLQVQNTVAQNRETHYTIAKLLHDVKVVAIDGYQRTLLEGSIIKVDIFDYFGNLENPITKTDNPAPLKNTLTFYSLYMHLLPSEEYTSEQKLPSYWQGKIIAKVTANGLQTYADDAARTSGAIIKGAIIKADGIFEYNPKDTLQHTVTNTATKKTETLTLTRCTFKTGGFKTNTTLNTNESFLAVIEEKTSKPIKAIPDNPNQVNLCIPPIAIKAGDTIGYLGLYETPKPPLSLVQSSDQSRPNPSMETNSKSQLHLEIFALDKRELTQFIENKAKLDSGKKYLKLLPNTVLQATISLPKPAGSTQPPANQQSTTTPPSAALTPHTLTKQHILALDKIKIETDTNKQQWYKIEVKEQQKDIIGYIKTNDPTIKLITQNDWQELGFTIIEESNPNNDGFLDKEQMSKFFQDLYNEIDEDKKDGVTQKELQAALKNQDLRDRWTKLIGYHPTEWQASSDDSKWSRLNTILANNKELLRHEKERIDKLRFWDDVPELKGKPQAFHIHPVAFYEYPPLSTNPPWLDIAWQEYEKYKGLKETQEPLLSATKKYFSITNSKGCAGDATPWCAAFVYWCLVQSGYQNSGNVTAYARAWNTNVTTAWYGYWKEGEIHKPNENNGVGKPFIGAIALQGEKNDITHLGIVVGLNKNGNPILLGGNQSDKLCLSAFSEKSIKQYVKPKGYVVSEALEELPTLKVEGGELSYEQTR